MSVRANLCIGLFLIASTGCAVSAEGDAPARVGFSSGGKGGSAGTHASGGQASGGAAGDVSSGGDVGSGGVAGGPVDPGSGGDSGGGGAAGAPVDPGSGGDVGSGGVAGSPSDPGTGGDPGLGGTGSSCPTGSSPPGPYAMRFDVATLACGSSGTCPTSPTKCFCQPEFEALDVSPAHFMGLGTDKQKPNVWAAGNVQAVYIDQLNLNISAGGAQRAADVIASAKTNFPCGVPKWFIVNEISAGLWPSDASYRTFVVDFAKAMKNTYGKETVIAAPFAAPGANAASWTALAQYAYVGVEHYIPGSEVNAHANSVSWCQAQYQASISAYGALGVPKNRLYLFEHFGNTAAGTNWGRGGASTAGWHNAIKARGQAIANLGFAGFLSYGWANNDMASSEADRIAFMNTYASQALP